MWEYSSCRPEMFHGSPWRRLPWGLGRCRGQWLKFLGRHWRSAQCWWKGSREPHHGGSRPQVLQCPHGDEMCKPMTWGLEDAGGAVSCGPFVPSLPRVDVGWSSPGKGAHCWCLHARGRVSHLAGWGWILPWATSLASPAVDGAPPSAPGARAWGFLALSESLMAKSIWIKGRKKMNSEGGKHFGSTSSSAGM